MRILIVGSKSFGATVAARIEQYSNREIVSVVSPAAKEGAVRHDALTEWGVERNLWDGPRLTADIVRMQAVDLIVAAHCHQFITPEARAASKCGALVGHPSLLPRHRGRSAIEWTIRMNDPIAGFTWFLADDGADTGPIIKQEWCHVVPGWTASDLWREELFSMGVGTVNSAIAQVYAGGADQDNRVATWEPSLDNIPKMAIT